MALSGLIYSRVAFGLQLGGESDAERSREHVESMGAKDAIEIVFGKK